MNLKFCSLNVNGLKRRINYPDFVEFVKCYDLFCAVETHLDGIDLVDIYSYAFIAKHRTQIYKRKFGRIGLYVKEKKSKYVKLILSNNEYILCFN